MMMMGKILVVFAMIVGVCGCETELRSVTAAHASLEFQEGLAGLWLTDRIGDEDLDLTPSSLEDLPVRALTLDGDSGLLVGEQPLEFGSNASLTTVYVSAGTFDVGVATGGQVLVEAPEVDLAADRFTYLIAFGTEDDPAVHVFSDSLTDLPDDARRVRIINVIPTRESIAFALYDEAGNPIEGTPVELAYGEAWSEVVPDEITDMRFEGGPSLTLDCNPATAILVDAPPLDSPTAPFLTTPSDPLYGCNGNSCACATGPTVN